MLFNDSGEAVPISRNTFVGPNLMIVSEAGLPLPPSVEPTFGSPDESFTLQPFAFYRRERSFTALLTGEIEVSASYRPEGGEGIATRVRLRLDPAPS